MAIHLAERVQFFYQWAVAEEAGRPAAAVAVSADSAAEVEVSAAAARARAGDENADAKVPQQTRARPNRARDP